MSEKRFTIDKDNRIFDNGEFISKTTVVWLLNTLHQENQQLKFQLEECTNNKLYSRRELEKENEKLKAKNKKLKNIVIWQQEIIQNYNELMQIVSSD